MWRMPRSRDGLPGGCRRVVKSLEDAKPQQRPEIIRARVNSREGRQVSTQTATRPPAILSPARRFMSLMQMVPSKSVTPQALRGTGYE